MDEVTPPTDLLAPLSPSARARTLDWWAGLAPSARAEFVLLWDVRTDDTALYGRCEDGRLVWHELPIELRGTIVDDDDDDGHHAQKQQLLEYIANHEEFSSSWSIEGSISAARTAQPER